MVGSQRRVASGEIHNSTSGKLFPALGSFIGAALFGFFMLKGLAIGVPGGKVFVLGLVALGCVGFGLFMAQ
ncbi:hypothetical protein [Mesorhizobium kowhaii]|uniref:Uncharacterized protein n=1 Tax=Mesorhizobium kowhaii TaxID=1300272 RepID=A0A2W7CPV3_9HYPH|nr:hypothetical protein [Mesorhizobium kowhaii]PZV38583.1 hypothetical protein B5V02_09510 [Mesorhizobium kowhaii]